MEEKNFSERVTKTNEMSAADLKVRNNANIDFVRSPKTGKVFFVCGSTKGYVSKAAQKSLENGSLTLESLRYCDMSIDGKPAVPCLMMVGNSKQNVLKTL